MQTFIRYLFLFIIGALSGWVLELAFRSIKNKSLTNPGFLGGPYLPLYGFGVIILHFFCSLDYSFIKGEIWQVVFYAAAVTLFLTLAELISGLIFINGLKIKLWDYSKLWLNFKGIICPWFSIIWGSMGLLYYFFINPWLSPASEWAAESLIVILLAGLIYGIFFSDLYNTLHIGTRIRKTAAKLKITINYELLKRNYKNKIREENQKMWFFSPFQRSSTFSLNFKEAITESRIYKKIKNIQKQHENEKPADNGTNTEDK